MTSFHGNKIAAGGICLCIIMLLFLFGELLSERKLRDRLFEKQYSEALTALEENNYEAKNEVY